MLGLCKENLSHSARHNHRSIFQQFAAGEAHKIWEAIAGYMASGAAALPVRNVFQCLLHVACTLTGTSNQRAASCTSISLFLPSACKMRHQRALQESNNCENRQAERIRTLDAQLSGSGSTTERVPVTGNPNTHAAKDGNNWEREKELRRHCSAHFLIQYCPKSHTKHTTKRDSEL